jgi:hypothetical protein
MNVDRIKTYKNESVRTDLSILVNVNLIFSSLQRLLSENIYVVQILDITAVLPKGKPCMLL